MGGSLSSVCFDPAKEVEGEWLVNYRGLGFDLLVARWNNPEHRRVLAEMAQAERKGLEPGKEITPDRWREITGMAMAQAIWIGSRHLEDDEGSPIECSPEYRSEHLNSPSFTELRDDIANFSMQDETYLARAVGNSEPASGGS